MATRAKCCTFRPLIHPAAPLAGDAPTRPGPAHQGPQSPKEHRHPAVRPRSPNPSAGAQETAGGMRRSIGLPGHPGQQQRVGKTWGFSGQGTTANRAPHQCRIARTDAGMGRAQTPASDNTNFLRTSPNNPDQTDDQSHQLTWLSSNIDGHSGRYFIQSSAT